MEKPASDEHILNYLDGLLEIEEVKKLEELIHRSPELKARLNELQAVHFALKANGKVEVPSKDFTQRVMTQLDKFSHTRGFSPKNGILLLCGILVAVGIALILLEAGKFDASNKTITLDTLPFKKEWIKNTIPSIHLNGKLVVKIIMMVAIGISLVLLDRTILRPMFQRRSGMI